MGVLRCLRAVSCAAALASPSRIADMDLENLPLRQIPNLHVGKQQVVSRASVPAGLRSLASAWAADTAA